MKSCVVFRPNPPKMFMLNLNAWLIFDLCDGRTAQEVEQSYRETVAAQMSAGEANHHLTAGLKTLQEQGLIELKFTNGIRRTE